MRRGSLLVVGLLALGACGGSSASAPASTVRITVLPETTQPALVPSGTEAPTATAPPGSQSIADTVQDVTPDPPATDPPVSEPPPTETPVTDPPATDPPSGAPSLAQLALSSSGIGGAQFGAEPEGVITFMSSFLGQPTADTGYVDPFEIGVCSGNEVRIVEWGTLALTFGDVSRVVQGQRHFYAYAYGLVDQPPSAPLGLATDTGITVGSSLADLLVAFPNLVLNPEDEFTPPSFFVNDDFRGYLTGLADDATVSVIFGGLGCSE